MQTLGGETSNVYILKRHILPDRFMAGREKKLLPKTFDFIKL